MARRLLDGPQMSTPLDSIYKKLAASLEPGGAGHAHEAKFDPARQISPAVAHELNNILTIIQGYADRLRTKHAADTTLEAQLKLVSDAARRATILVRSCTPPELDGEPRPNLIPSPTAPR